MIKSITTKNFCNHLIELNNVNELPDDSSSRYIGMHERDGRHYHAYFFSKVDESTIYLIKADI